MRKAKLLLTLAMAAAVTSTAAMSFAQWDTLSDSVNGTVTLGKPITVTATQTTNYTANTRELDAKPTYTGTVTVDANVTDMPGTGTANLTLTPVIKQGDIVVTTDFDITVVDKSTESTPTIPNTDGKHVDSTVAETNQYEITLTPAATDISKAPDYMKNGAEISIEMTAELGVTPASGS